MVIGSHQQILASGNEEVNGKINGTPITRVHRVKPLGLLIDEHLTWKDHVDKVVILRKYRRLLELLNE